MKIDFQRFRILCLNIWSMTALLISWSMTFLMISLPLNCGVINANSNEVIIQEFLEDCLLNENHTISFLDACIDLPSVTLSTINNEHQEVILSARAYIRYRLKRCQVFDIVPHSSPAYREQIEELNLQYQKMEQVYHLIADEEIITSFIMEKGKVISFFYSMSKHEHQTYPAILSEMD